ncbi:MAG TPA: ribonuclease Z [Micromonosporaceae bacterium]|nr:ribonuclease Z [Micromonosporaceae bacterium]
MSVRELVVLGTASAVPTRERNHNGYLLRWDGEGVLFDPGEGTQRQMTLAGLSGADITRICITHFHGDHTFGVPGIVARLASERVAHSVAVHYPAAGAHYFARLRYAAAYDNRANLRELPVLRDGLVDRTPVGDLHAAALSHTVDAYGYRLVEPDGRRMLPDRLAAHGVAGPAIAQLQRDGEIDVGGRTVTLDEVSEPRRGQRFAFVMDTRLCDNVYALAVGADMLVIESTYLDADAGMAREWGHLTAAQAGQVAQRCGVRTLVLTHFSQRYPNPAAFGAEAGSQFNGEIVVASDLARVPVPKRV